RLLVPSTVGVLVFQFIQGYVNMSLGDAIRDLSAAGVPAPVIYLIMVASGIGVLWFCQLLWVYSLILLLIRRIEKGRVLTLGAKTPLWMVCLFVLPVWLLGQVLNVPVISVYRIAFYLAFFLLGYYIFSHDAVMERLKGAAVLFIGAGAVLCVTFGIVYFYIGKGANFADAPVNRGILFALCAYFGSLAVLAGFARFGDFSSAFTDWMSRRSFGLYVFHYLGISAVALLIAKPALLPAPVCYFLSLVAGFLLGYGLYAVISRIPFFRWAVLGIRKKRG
ncbi:MAG: acyltransferase family protein, partial [Clostridia bacterium]|nr:acyltransferase family protein [Clostridia bacterium]